MTDTLAFISGDDVRSLVPMSAAVRAIEDAFGALRRGEFELPVRTSMGNGAVLVMPIRHTRSGTAAIKWLSMDFSRDPAIRGSVAWVADGESVQFIADAPTVTALRTGAAAGVATSLLSKHDASRLVVFGPGAQCFDQVMGVHTVRPLSSVTVVGRPGSDRLEPLVEKLRLALPRSTVSGTFDVDAVADADIICTATSSLTPVFQGPNLPTDVHINAMGSYRPDMREIPEDVLRRARVVVVDDLSAAEAEAGEIIHALQQKSLTPADIPDLASALRSPPERAGGITLFKSVGLALQDWAVMSLLADSLSTDSELAAKD